ncbi:MAG: class II fructose-bisphosphate aldolase [Candidatus Promineifilaceae bacterium]
MPLASFSDLMAAADAGRYAVGYFESWDLASLMAVADAAEDTRSPVFLGFSGLYLPHPDRIVREPLSVYANVGLAVGNSLSVPAALVFNESPDMSSVLQAAELGFNLVMYADETLDPNTLKARIRKVSRVAHRLGVAVEGEMVVLPGVSGTLAELPSGVQLTDPRAAATFVAETNVDALAVNLGQMHLHGRQILRLDLDRLQKIKEAVPLPLVLHGASSVNRDDLAAAIELGIRKVNVSSLLKQAYFEALRAACAQVGDTYNPYTVVGSGLDGDILSTARLALQKTTAELMHLLGSAGKA